MEVSRNDGPLQPSADAYKESDLLQSADRIKNTEIQDVSEYLVETGDEEPGDLSPTAPEAADDFQDVILEDSVDD